MAASEKPGAGAPVADVLAHAAAVAGSAPSIHNTQPWRWEAGPDSLEMYAERSRQLTATDPDGRMMTVSCGAALHHARVALAAWGWQPAVSRLPEAGDPDLLARIRLDGTIPITPQAEELLGSIGRRHTDRRPVARRPVPREALAALVSAATGEGARLQVLRPEDVDDVARSAALAAEVDATDPAIQAELGRWTGGERETTGLPDAVIPDRPPQTNVPGREFAFRGTLHIGTEHDKDAIYALLYGDEDDPAGWLSGGEALSALWLTAVRLGLGVLPISEAVEMPASRQILRGTLAFMGWPYLAMRIGVPDPGEPEPAGTPRLPAEETVHTHP
jgi:nitroreductase